MHDHAHPWSYRAAGCGMGEYDHSRPRQRPPPRAQTTGAQRDLTARAADSVPTILPALPLAVHGCSLPPSGGAGLRLRGTGVSRRRAVCRGCGLAPSSMLELKRRESSRTRASTRAPRPWRARRLSGRGARRKRGIRLRARAVVHISSNPRAELVEWGFGATQDWRDERGRNGLKARCRAQRPRLAGEPG